MATGQGAAVAESDGWQDYAPPKKEEEWQDYTGTKPITNQGTIGPRPAWKPGQEVRSPLETIENYTQEGRKAHPILSRIGDATRNAKDMLRIVGPEIALLAGGPGEVASPEPGAAPARLSPASAPPEVRPIEYKPTEKAETMSAERKPLGPEFEAGEVSHEIDRNKAIVRHPQATPEDIAVAKTRLAELQGAGEKAPPSERWTGMLTAEEKARTPNVRLEEMMGERGAFNRGRDVYNHNGDHLATMNSDEWAQFQGQRPVVPANPSQVIDVKPVNATATPQAAAGRLQPVGPAKSPRGYFNPGRGSAGPTVDQVVNDAMGVKPLEPNTPLRDQPRASSEVAPAVDPIKAKYPDPAVRQMVRANGEKIVEAVGTGNPALMKQIHDLTRVELRQAAINAEIDMGQKTVSNSKFAGEGSIKREDMFNQLLEKGLTPEKIVELAKQKPEAAAATVKR